MIYVEACGCEEVHIWRCETMSILHYKNPLRFEFYLHTQIQAHVDSPKEEEQWQSKTNWEDWQYMIY